MREFILSVAEGVRQNPKNNKYDTQAKITKCEELKQAALFDHVAARLHNNERGNDNFIEADCLIMDCDNGHSDKPELWLTPAKLHERLPDVELAIVYSRNHMAVKTSGEGENKKEISARPRFHIYLPTSQTITEAQTIRDMKERLIALIPELDDGAKDATRLIYGVENPQVEFFAGALSVDQYLTANAENSIEYDPPEENNDDSEEETPDTESGIIPHGTRNNTIYKKACSLIRTLGEINAIQPFNEACAKCQPPLPPNEIADIWNNALKFVKREIKKEQKKGTGKKKKILTLAIMEKTLQELNISVQYNLLTKDIEISDLPPDNEHVPPSYYSLDAIARKKATTEIFPTFLTTYFKSLNYSVNDGFILNAIAALAITHPLNPVREMLNATTWDGHDRLADLYKVLNIDSDTTSANAYRIFLRKWLHQAVSLVLNDAGDLNSDFVLVLQGKQGIGKTNFFRTLAMKPAWFEEGAVIDMQRKDTYIQATATWITELGELDSTLKKEQSSLKAFITANSDTFRRPYARKAEKTERRTVFCATVNPEETIRDDTGSRRYIFIHVDSINKQFLYNDMTPEWCAQLWRQVYETLYLHKGRKGFYLTDDERAFVEENNSKFTVPLDGETELRDSLTWESDISLWNWTTIKELEESCPYLKDKRIKPRNLGRAIMKILAPIIASKSESPDDKFRRLVNGRTQYYLPRVKVKELYEQ